MENETETKTLIDAASRCFQHEIYPVLPKSAQYAGAMIRRALLILLREIVSQQSMSEEELAKEIRLKQRTDNAELVAQLFDHVRNKLVVNSPKFLEESETVINQIGAKAWVYEPSRIGETKKL